MEESPPDLQGITLIIRAHGISPRLEQTVREKGGRIVDATCPRVKASQTKAASLVEDAYALFLAGEAAHSEILGIQGYAPGCTVVGNAAEAEAAAQKLHLTNAGAKTALIGQTTICEEEYAAISCAIQKYFPSLEIMQTICSATKERQESLRQLLDKVDAVVIAGGKESANTRRLLAIAQERGKPCVLVENADEIPAEFAVYETLGLCAGASTPDSVIDEIERALVVASG
jgi:4-hydroxy-3-methylbut-2-enyl diphosphate reductase